MTENNGFASDRYGPSPSDPDRLPPHSEESERSLLACIIAYPEKLEEVRAKLAAADFYFDAHQKIFRAINHLHDCRDPVDLVGLAEELRSRKQLADVGGEVGLAELVADAGFVHEWHVKRIQGFALRRAIIHATVGLARDSYDGTASPEELLDLARAELERIAQRSASIHANPLIAGALDNAAFNKAAYDHHWMIEEIMVENEPVILGGPSKTMKTGIVVEAAVSIASGKPFLDLFKVPDPRPVFVLSAESGAASLQARMRQVCQAKGIDPDTLGIVWYTRVEMLSTPEGCRNLGAALKHFGAKVAILDPSYLLLGGEVTLDSPGNLFAMGRLLAAVGTACLDAGATPIIVAHSNAQVQLGKPMELTGIAFAGFQQWARQWWLLSRREAYEDDGKHKMLLRFGGSAGHTGLIDLDIEEGTFDRGGAGKKWEVRAQHSQEARKARKDEEAAEELRQLQEDAGKVLVAMAAILEGGSSVATRFAVKEASGMSAGRVSKAIDKLIGDEAIVETTGSVRCGMKGFRTVIGIRRPEGWSK